MQVFLQILSVIGIIILCILAVLLLLIFCLLFVPVRYRADGRKDSETWKVSAKVSWLLHLVSLRAEYPDPGMVRVKVLFIPIFTYGGSSAANKKQKARKPRKSSKTLREEEVVPEEPVDTDTEQEVEEIGTEKDAVPSRPKEHKESKDREEQQKEASSFRNRIDAWIQSVKRKWEKIKYTIHSFCDKIKEIIENWNYYRALLEEEETKQLFHKCKKRIGKVLKSIRPRKIIADILFGTGSPDTTGYVLAIYSMLYPYLGNTINIVPDFEQVILEGEAHIKGKVRLIVLLKLAMSMMLDKDIKLFIQKLKREDM